MSTAVYPALLWLQGSQSGALPRLQLFVGAPSLPRAASFKRADLKPVSLLDAKPSPATGSTGHVGKVDRTNEEINSKTQIIHTMGRYCFNLFKIFF